MITENNEITLDNYLQNSINSCMPETPTAAWNFIVECLHRAQARGIFKIDESAALHFSMERLRFYLAKSAQQSQGEI